VAGLDKRAVAGLDKRGATMLPAAPELVAWPGGGSACQHTALSRWHRGLC